MAGTSFEDFMAAKAAQPATENHEAAPSGFEAFMANKKVPPADKNAFVSTLKSTGASLLNSAAGQPLEDIGAENNMPAVQQFGKGVREYSEDVQKANPSKINTLSDVVEHPIDALQTAAGNVLPQLPVSLASGWAGAKAGAALPLSPQGKAIAGTVGGLAGLFAPSYAQEYSEMRGKQHEEGKEDIGKALGYAVPAAASDVVLDKMLLGGSKLLPASLRNAAADTLAPGASRLAHVGKQAAKGVGLEGGQEYGQTYLEQLGGNQDTSTEKAADERNVSAALGGIGGGMIKGGTGALDAREAEAEPATTEQQQLPAEPEETSAELPEETEGQDASSPEQPAPVADQISAAIPAETPANPQFDDARNDLANYDAFWEGKEQPAAVSAKLAAVAQKLSVPVARGDRTEAIRAAIDAHIAQNKPAEEKIADAVAPVTLELKEQLAAAPTKSAIGRAANVAIDGGITQPQIAATQAATDAILSEQAPVIEPTPPVVEDTPVEKPARVINPKHIDIAERVVNKLDEQSARPGYAGLPTVPRALRSAAVDLGVYNPEHTPDEMRVALRDKINELRNPELQTNTQNYTQNYPENITNVESQNPTTLNPENQIQKKQEVIPQPFEETTNATGQQNQQNQNLSSAQTKTDPTQKQGTPQNLATAEIKADGDPTAIGQQGTNVGAPSQPVDVETGDVPVSAEVPELLAPVAQAAVAHVQPTDDQIATEEYPTTGANLQGVHISTENKAGSERKGVDEDGNAWSVTMQDNYGFIPNVQGADKDHLDVFTPKDLTPEQEAKHKKVFIVDQINPKTGDFDEHKVMMGYPTIAAARKAYARNYSADWKGLGAITGMPIEKFKEWIKNPEAVKAALAYKAPVKAEEANTQAAETVAPVENSESELNKDTPVNDFVEMRKRVASSLVEDIRESKPEIAKIWDGIFKIGEDNGVPISDEQYSTLLKISNDIRSGKTPSTEAIQALSKGLVEKAAVKPPEVEYHPAIRSLANELVEEGGVAFTTDERGAYNGRTQSVNPDWFKDRAFVVLDKNGNPLKRHTSVASIKQAVADYVAGKQLKEAQKRILQALSDVATYQEEFENQQYPEYFDWGQDIAALALENKIDSGIIDEQDLNDLIDDYDDGVGMGEEMSPQELADFWGIIDDEEAISGSSEIHQGETLSAYDEEELAARDAEQKRLAKAEKEAAAKAAQRERADKEVDSLADEMLGNFGTADVFGETNPLAKPKQPTEYDEFKQKMAPIEALVAAGKQVDAYFAALKAKAPISFERNDDGTVSLHGGGFLTESFRTDDKGWPKHKRLEAQFRKQHGIKDQQSASRIERFGGKASVQQETPLETFATAQEAEAHLADKFGPGVNTLVKDGRLVFTQGKEAWPQAAKTNGHEAAEAVYINGKAYVDLQATDRSRMQPVLLHEIGEHYNLKYMLGTQAYNNLQSQIAHQAKIKSSLAESVWNEVKRDYAHLTEGSEVFVSEVLAKLGEKNPNAPWYRRLMSTIKTFLMQRGLARGFIAGTMTAEDMHTLLVASLKSAAKGRTMNSPSFYNAAVAMASRTAATKDASEKRVKELFKGAQPEQAHGVKLLDKSDILDLLGLTGKNKNVLLAEKHGLVRGKSEHAGFSEADWNKVPEWLDNPVAVFKQADGDYRFIGPDLKDGNPVVMAVTPNSELQGQRGNSVGVLKTAFAKDDPTKKMPVQSWLDNGDLVYVDLTKTAQFNAATGYKLPVRLNDLKAIKQGINFKNSQLAKQKRKPLANPDVKTEVNLKEYLKSLAAVEAVDTIHSTSATEQQGKTGSVPESAKAVKPQFSFAGQKAQTADKGQLTTAQQRTENGENAEDVRQDTGWHKGVDGKWKFEISDKDAKLTPLGLEAPLEGDPNAVYSLDEILKHDALFKAYPELKAFSVKFDAAEGTLGQFHNGVISLTNSRVDLSTVLHELQHGIQKIEGFAAGGSPNQFRGMQMSEDDYKKFVDEVHNKANAARFFKLAEENGTTAKEEIAAEEKRWGFETQNARVKELVDMFDNFEEADSWYKKDKGWLDNYRKTNFQDPAENYHKLAGEVEARNTQARARLSDEHRKMVSPEETADVKNEDQIVNFAGEAQFSLPATLKSDDVRFSFRGVGPIPSSPELERYTAAANDAMDSFTDKVYGQRLAFLSVRQIIELAKSYLPSAATYEDRMQARRTVIDSWLQRTDRPIATWKALSKIHGRQLGKVMQDSTLSDVDASQGWTGVSKTPEGFFRAHSQAKFNFKNLHALHKEAKKQNALSATNTHADFRTEAAAKAYEQLLISTEQDQTAFRAGRFRDENPKRQAEHARLNTAFTALPEKAKSVYSQTNNLHKEMFADRVAALEERITDSILDGKKRAAMIAEMRKQFEDNSLSWYYAPLSRFGKHWFYGKDAQGVNWFRSFETEKGRNKAIKEFEEARGELLGAGTTMKDMEGLKMEGGSDNFILSVNQMLSESKLPKDQADSLQDAIYQMYLSTLPEVSMRHSAQHRKGTKGFNEDAMQNFAHSMHHGASQLANMREGREMEKALDNMKAVVDMAQYKGRQAQALAEIEAAQELSDRWDELSPDGVLADELKQAAGDDERVKTLREMQNLRNKFGALDEADAQEALGRFADNLQKTHDDSKLINLENSVKASATVDEIAKTYKAMVNTASSDMDNVAGYLRQVGFIYNLGFSFSSGVMNTFQTPGAAMPVAFGKYGMKKTLEHFGKNSALFKEAVSLAFGHGGQNQRDEDGNASITVPLVRERDRFSPGSAEWKRLNDKFLAMLAFKEGGHIARTQTFDVIGVGKEGDMHGGALQDLSKRMGWMFHHGERLNREITLSSAYDLARAGNAEMNVPAMNHQDALDYAIYVNNRAHFDYSPENAPRIFRGWPAAIALQFKKYQQGMLFLWGKSWADSLSSNWKHLPEGTEAEKKAKAKAKQDAQAAGRTLGALVIMQTAFAGAFGLPLVGTLSVFLNAIGSAISDDDEPWDWRKEARTGLKDLMGERFATAATKGLFNAFTPVDVAGRMDSADLLFREPLKDLEGRDAATNYLASLTGPTGGLVTKLWEAGKLLSEGNAWRAAETASPKVMADVLKATRFAKEDARSMTGSKIKDMGWDEIVIQALGFGSSELRNKQTERAYVKADEAAIGDARQKLVTVAAEAKMTGRPLPAEEIRAFNLRNPQWKITSDNVRQSVARSKKSEKERGTRGYSVNPKLDYLYDQDSIMDDDDE